MIKIFFSLFLLTCWGQKNQTADIARTNKLWELHNLFEQSSGRMH